MAWLRMSGGNSNKIPYITYFFSASSNVLTVTKKYNASGIVVTKAYSFTSGEALIFEDEYVYVQCWYTHLGQPFRVTLKQKMNIDGIKHETGYSFLTLNDNPSIAVESYTMASGESKTLPTIYTLKGIDGTRFNFAKSKDSAISFVCVDYRIETVSFGTKVFEDDVLTLYTEYVKDLSDNIYGIKFVFKKKCLVNGIDYASGSNYRASDNSSLVVNIVNE